MSYKQLVDLVKFINHKNTDGNATILFGINIDKFFMPSVANIIGVDLKKYKVVEKYQFACNRMHVGRDKRLPISMSTFDYDFIVSPAYDVFEVSSSDVLPEYLMLWFRRKEFDRQCWFYTDADVRGGLHLDALKSIEVKIPSIEEQRQIVAQYQSIANKIKVNEQICEKLEAAAQALYKHWFVNFEFPNEDGKPYKSSSGKMVWNEELEKGIPEEWEVKSLGEVCDKIASGSTPSGGKENYKVEGISLVRSMNVHDLEFIYDDLAYIDNEQAKKLSNVIIESKDLLFNITGVSVARCAIIPRNVLPARVNQHVMIIRPTRENNLNYYLLMNLISSESKNALLGISQSGSTREAITKSEIENFKVLIPGSNELMLFENQVDYLFDYKNTTNNQNQKLIQLQSLLLSRLVVSGEFKNQ